MPNYLRKRNMKVEWGGGKATATPCLCLNNLIKTKDDWAWRRCAGFEF